MVCICGGANRSPCTHANSLEAALLQMRMSKGEVTDVAIPSILAYGKDEYAKIPSIQIYFFKWNFWTLNCTPKGKDQRWSLVE